MRPKFYGVITPFITPFKEDLSLDLDSARWLARYQAEGGVHGIFPNSTTGEFVHLSKEEAVKLTGTVLEEVGGKVWIIPGISANSTEDSISLGRIFKNMGVSGTIITPPFFFKVSGERLKLHFSMVAERVDLPIIIYNIPSATGINIPISLYRELSEEYSNIVGAKVTYENFTYLRGLIQEVKSVREDFSILVGFDDMLLPNLMMGGDGGIMALANAAPKIHRNVYDFWREGSFEKALEWWKKLLELTKVYDISTSFPTAVKTLLSVMGSPVKPYVRPPLTPERDEVVQKVRKIAESLGLKI
ncbi:dihydrodipicolinate synthase family protein [Fervidicoccus fontis]|uniref:Dihydrodipicolinate synthase n=2 Tax=Fervidicoccus fontis TaxID=683846 RepID=H9ZZQ9_FERFK|nr:dihydrodipicolinate synthase family protein [Fervidicoccus fontis]AFH42216.1 dihydrodipicolinate synthase [Fervidicoccus fontis Kam940]PMB75386.1 MAG: 4-hydroxy-tetrahydrodipicolinate synthase [Fervidicoccus fontis]PMB76278.1 MAG: 4-hydroxy-tetrahydrodipicolinate synthase [Fervidicoccus fontis]HEW64246.1 dihydrodipicolinate synthase family protein [Fervidicoccus fontis]